MNGGDVNMDTGGPINAFDIDTEFLETRREQCTLHLRSRVRTVAEVAFLIHRSQASISYP